MHFASFAESRVRKDSIWDLGFIHKALIWDKEYGVWKNDGRERSSTLTREGTTRSRVKEMNLAHRLRSLYCFMNS